MTEPSNCVKCGKKKEFVFVGDALFDEVCLNCFELAIINRRVPQTDGKRVQSFEQEAENMTAKIDNIKEFNLNMELGKKYLIEVDLNGELKVFRELKNEDCKECGKWCL